MNAIDYKKWERFSFTPKISDEIICPICSKGKLIFKEELFHAMETKQTKELENYSYFDVMIHYQAKFTGFLLCDYKNCQEYIIVVGDKFVTTDDEDVIIEDDGSITQSLTSVYYPEYFQPPIEIFKIEKYCPKEVKHQLISSFKHFFSDTEASANRLRVAIEILCDELKVIKKPKKTIGSPQRKQNQFTLHQRILELKKTKPEVAEMLLSIKWIGNYASHKDTVKRTDILDGYSFMQVVLNNIYDNNFKVLQKKSQKINKTKKPLSK